MRISQSDERLLLSVEALSAGYGSNRVLQDVSLRLAAGQMLAVIGHNGAGKSTLLRALMGLLPAADGEVFYNGVAVTSSDTRSRLSMGMSYVPQGSAVFPDFLVYEQFRLIEETMPASQRRAEGLSLALELFPQLHRLMKRKASTLSGGERQIVAISSGIIRSPSLLLLDEPSMGLAGDAVKAMFAYLRMIQQRDRVGIVIVEQNIRETLKAAERVCVLTRGRIVFDGSSAEMLEGKAFRTHFLT